MFALLTVFAVLAAGTSASLLSPIFGSGGHANKGGLKCTKSTVYTNSELVSVKLPGGHSVSLGFSGAENANGSAYWQEYTGADNRNPYEYTELVSCNQPKISRIMLIDRCESI